MHASQLGVVHRSFLKPSFISHYGRAALRSRRIVTRMAAAEAEIIAVTQRLLHALSAGDYEAYKVFCAEDITCFEPESVGHQVSGLDFHKYYFDNIDFKASADAQAKGKPLNLNTMVDPKVRVYGDAAIISYVRLTQKGGASPITSRAEETRVWEKRGGKWVVVHFHKSMNL